MAQGYTYKLTEAGKAFERQMKELGDLEVAVGFQAGEASEDNGADVLDVAAWNEFGTINMPSRPFMHDSWENNQDRINEMMEKVGRGISDGSIDAQQGLEMLGLFGKDLVQETITEGNFTPNADATVKIKGSSVPLIDTGQMRQSVNYVIRAKGSGQ